jgi:hypothetical protein
MAGIVLVSWLVWLGFRMRSERTRMGLVIGLCALAVALYLFEKYWLSFDTEYLATVSGGFNMFDELPLHLCNINTLLIPVALLLKRRVLLVFCCLSAPIGAFLAFISPIAVFSESSLLLPRNIGYYGTHALLIVASTSLVTLRLCRPDFKYLPRVITLMFALVLAMHLVNTTLRTSGISSHADYFFTYGPDSTVILEPLWQLIPIPFVYELPLLLVVVAYGYAATALVLRLLARREPAHYSECEKTS